MNAMTLAMAVSAICITCVRSDDGWYQGHASAYGLEASVWDQGYGGLRTAWGFHCDPGDQGPWAVMSRESVGVAHRTLPLGSWVELRIPMPHDWGYLQVVAPITDRGPFVEDWDWDLQEPLVLLAGWGRAGPPPAWLEGEGPFFNRRDIEWRLRPDLPRHCPAFGYTTQPQIPEGMTVWEPVDHIFWFGGQRSG